MGRSCVWFMICFTVFHLVDSHSTVRFLPGFEGPLPFELETGYVGVDESENIKLFYYFIKSEGNPREDPLMIWLSGGPGCTSLSGLAFEIGPITFKVKEYDGRVPTLVSTPFSWTKVASIIFLDSPVDTGFSYSRNKEGIERSDRKQAYQIDQFLRKWLIDHPEFVTNQFYVGGDSYSGMVVPATVHHISQGNEQGVKPLINLQGYVLGNPTTDVRFDSNSKIPYAHGMGLISDELFSSLQRSCEGNYINVNPSNSRCLKELETYNKCVSRINKARIQDPLCDFASPKPFFTESAERRYLREFPQSDLLLPSQDCYTYRYVLSSYWANNESVREALRVDKGSIGKWIRCNFGLPYKMDIQSSIPYHLSNSVKGFRSLVYSGDHDMTVPFVGTQAWIRFLNYSIVDDWRPWMINSQVAGYTRAYANRMTFATIKGGGHTVEYTPKESFVMFQRWISGEPL